MSIRKRASNREIAPELCRDVGQRIYERRRFVGLTTIELARKLEVDKGTVSYWESGRSLPSAAYLFPLHLHLECSIHWLLTGESDAQHEAIDACFQAGGVDVVRQFVAIAKRVERKT